MAALEEASCSDIHKDPNFAVICSFIEQYGELLGFQDLSFSDLQRYLEDTRAVNRNLHDILLKLLRRWKSSFNTERWFKHLIKFCHTYSQVDAWELEEFGLPRIKISTKLRILKNLLEVQFDTNNKFKEKINEKPAESLRYAPLGRDKNGLAYWYLLDKDFNVRVYREDEDDVEAETWEMVVSDRSSLRGLISTLVEQQVDKSRSVTPCSQDGDLSQDGMNGIKVEPKEEISEEKESASEVKKEGESVVKTESDVTSKDIKQESQEVKTESDSPESKVKVTTDEQEVDDKPDVKVKDEVKDKVKDGVKVKDKVKDGVKVKDRVKDGVKVKDEVKDKQEVTSTQETTSAEEITATETEEKSKQSLVNIKEEPEDSEPEKESDDKAISKDSTEQSEKDNCCARISSNKPTHDKEESADVTGESETAEEVPEPLSKEKRKITDKDDPDKKSQIDKVINNKEKISKNENDKSQTEDGSSDKESESQQKESETKQKESETEELKHSSNKNKDKSKNKGKSTEAVESTQPEDKIPSTEPVKKTAPPQSDRSNFLSEFERFVIKDQEATAKAASLIKGSKKAQAEENALKKRKRRATGENEVPEGRVPKLPIGRRLSQRRGRKPRKEELITSEEETEEESPVLSDSQSDTGSEVNSDEPPSKRKRDRVRKRASNRERHKEVPKSEDSTEENLEERSPPSKKQRKPVEEQDENNKPGNKSSETNSEAAKSNDAESVDKSESKVSDESDEKSQSGSDKENLKKKRGRGSGIREVEGSDYEPTSKKGRPAMGGVARGRGRGRGRGKGRGRGRGTLPTIANSEGAEDSDDVPLIQLRRSSRANKGRRVVEEMYPVETPTKKSKKAQEEEERRQAEKEAKAERKALRKAKKEEKLKKKKKRPKEMSDTEFVPGGKKNGKKKSRRKKNDSESESEEEEEDEDELFQEVEEEEESLKFSSGSCSEVELDSTGEEYQPTGRNAKRVMARHQKVKEESEESTSEEEEEEFNCCKCEKANHPEWMLLCDNCDSGYHTACLRPPLMIIPDGDWYCPPCEHSKLIDKLQGQLKELEGQMKAKERLVKRKERLAYVGISLDNILPDHGGDETEPTEEELLQNESRKRKERHRRQRAREYYAWETDKQRGYQEWSDSEEEQSIRTRTTQSKSTSESDSSSSSEEEDTWMVTRRSCRERKEINYKFDDYDKIMNSAILDDAKPAYVPPVETEVKPTKYEDDDKPTKYEDDDDDDDEENEGSDEESPKQPKHPSSGGKDLTNLLGPSPEKSDTTPVKSSPTIRPKPAPSRGKDMSHIPGLEEDEGVGGRPPPVVRKRKGRKLTQLDSDAEEEGEESEGYKASEDSVASDDDIKSDECASDDFIPPKRNSRHSRRSSRKKHRRKWDDDFVVDGDYDSEEEGYRRSGRRSARRQVSYREASGTDSEASGPTNRKSASLVKRKRVSLPEDSEEEESDANPKAPRKRKESSDYTPSEDSDVGKKKRGKPRKVNYRDMIGSDSDKDNEVEPAKKKKGGRMDVKSLVKSSSEASETDEYFSGKASEENSDVGEEKSKSSKKVKPKPKVNGLSREESETDSPASGPVKPKSKRNCRPADQEPEGDDDVEDVEDLVDFVTKE